MTNAQRAILNAVIQSGRHLSADEVYWIVRQRFPSIALGTIYRNLNRFADSGRIRRVVRANSADCFEGNTLPHDHALCIRCGNMTDIKIPHMNEFLKSQIDYDIISFDLIVNYICPDCSGKEGTNGDSAYAERKKKTDETD